MSVLSRLFGVAFGLPRVVSHAVVCERDCVVPVEPQARADLWYARGAGHSRLPVIVFRTPYRRRESDIIARVSAERGFRVVMASCRGRYGSEAVWTPFADESADGQSLIAWIKKQPWCDGRVFTWGASYQGFCEWALTAQPDPSVKAMSIVQSDTDPRSIVYPHGILGLETVLAWLTILEGHQSTSRMLMGALFGDRSHRAVYARPDLERADRTIVGHSVDFYQEWLRHEPESAYWTKVVACPDADRLPPVLMVGGWYDLHVSGQVRDFVALRQAGGAVRLVIGPWNHESLGITGPILRESFAWFAAEPGPGPGQECGLRLFVVGAGQWIDLPDWPAGGPVTTYYLGSDEMLKGTPPSKPAVRVYVYSPDDPTPSAGGATTIVGKTAGVKDQHTRERRMDVVTYTTDRLAEAVRVIGEPEVTLFVRSDAASVDFFVRVCDVAPSGRSFNVTDGMVRVRADAALPVAGVRRIHLALGPIACEFAAGHRVRLQVSSGDHPMHLRNPNLARVEVFAGPDHPSALSLPVCPASTSK